MKLEDGSMDIQMDTYTIGGIVAISAGGYLIFKAYNNMKVVSYWTSIGMTVVGGMLVWGGVRLFGAKSASEKKKDTKAIKKELTKAVASIGGDAVEVAAVAAEGDAGKCVCGVDCVCDCGCAESGICNCGESCPCDCGCGVESYEAEFTERQRTKLAKKGFALPDGSFPIRNRNDLENAIKLWGLAKNKSQAKKFIKKRARQLDAMNELPATW